MLNRKIEEQFDHRGECQECRGIVDTVPAEGVADQLLRGCPECGAVFWQEVDPIES